MALGPVLLEEVTEELYARHTADPAEAAAARAEYEERRGKVHQDDPLWEAWSAAFVEWFVVERIAPGQAAPAAAATYHAYAAAGDPRAPVVRALLGSHRSLFEVRGSSKGTVELLDLLGGAELAVIERRALHGVEVGDVAELRLVGVPGYAAFAEGSGTHPSTPGAGVVRFGRTFIYHPKVARDAIVDRARAMRAQGQGRLAIVDAIAQLRLQVTRYRHMSPARVYELGSRIVG